MGAGGFDAAFPQLFAVAYRVAYRTLGSQAEAEDVAQEALTRALLRWTSVEDRSQAWVATVAFRLAIDVGRRRKHRSPDEVTDQPVNTPDWDRRLDLQAALRRLPRRQQQALACRYLADLPDEETARLLDISIGAVKQHAARGLAALRPVVTAAEGTSHA